MYCQNRIVHTVQAGDSLYQLSKQYHTTVTELILGNPGVNPYNLQIGMRLNVCPGEEYQASNGNVQRPNPNDERPGQMPNGPMNQAPNQMPGEMPERTPNQAEDEVLDLMEAMRLAWLDHVYWNRMYLMSVDAEAKDQPEVEERALQTADEITDAFAGFLPISATRQLRNLLTEHIELAGEIIRTLKSANMENYDELIKSWYANANQIAALLAGQNPYFGGRETRNMLLNHLDVTREEIEHQINGEYAQSIDTFRDVKNQALEMADYFARGLLAR